MLAPAKRPTTDPAEYADPKTSTATASFAATYRSIAILHNRVVIIYERTGGVSEYWF
jgi:hypothetical protein